MKRTFLQLCLTSVVIAALAPLSAFAKAESRPIAFPLYFESNEGQTDPSVRYLARGAGYTVFLTPQEATLLLRDSNNAGTAVRMKMLGASNDAQIAGTDLQPSRSNYLRGADPSRWRRDIPHFGKVRYSGVYPGIDVVFYGNEQRLEYDFIVAPGANPRAIALAFDGVGKMSVDARGDLLLNIGGGRVLRQHKPVVYQNTANGRREIPASYALRRDARVEFKLGRYDRSKPLIIDPVLSYSTYHGGGYQDYGNAVAVDANGYAYITGQASATFNFPTTPGAVRTTPAADGYSDAFLAKFDPRGQLVYSTILGGGGPDVAFGVAADAAGNAYVAAELSSLDPPLTPGSFRTVASGADAYVVKINPQGNSVLYGVRVGGIYDDRTYGIAVDRDGQAVVTGVTNGSQDFYTVNAAQPTYGGGYTDAFVFKVNATGSALVYSTYLGGGTDVFNNNRRTDEGNAVAVDAAGNAYVTGYTSSDDFPTTPGALTRLGDMDPFVTKYSPAGQVVYSARFGGDARDIAWGIAVDRDGHAYVAGETDAIYPYPTTPGAFQETGTFDAFVTKLNQTGSAMVYSTLLGGTAGNGSDNGTERARAIAVDAAGQAHVTGYTRSRNFPVRNAIYPTHTLGGLYFDVFVTKFNAAGSDLLFSTFLGGNGDEEGTGIAIDANGGIYVTGLTASTTFPTTPGAPQRVNASDDGNGSAHNDAFLTKISEPPRTATPARPLFMSADFGGDGNAEIVWKHGRTGEHAMWELSGRTLINGRVFATTDVNWEIQGFGDWDGDGKADLVLRNRSTNQIATWLMNGRTIVSSKTVVTLGSPSWELQAIGNFNSDHRSEIVWRHMSTGQLAMWELNRHTLVNGNVFTTLTDRDWELLTSGDFNADGRSELLWRHALSGELAMWDLNGRTVTNTGVFANMFDPNWKLAATGDFNGDRRTDLIWKSSATGEVKLWEMSGRTVLRAQTVYTVSDLAWQLETAGDFNRDGRSELIWRNVTSGDVAMWEMNGAVLLNGAVFYSVRDLNWVIQPARRTVVATAAAASISSLAMESEASSEPGFMRDGFVDAWPHPETSTDTKRWTAEDPAKTPAWTPAEPPSRGGRGRANPRERH